MPLIKLNATQGLTGTLPAVSGANLTNIDGGKVAQVLTTLTQATSDTSSSNSWVDIMSLAITPSASSSKILVLFNANLSTNTNDHVGIKVVRGSTDINAGNSGSGTRDCFTSIRMMTNDAYSVANFSGQVLGSQQFSKNNSEVSLRDLEADSKYGSFSGSQQLRCCGHLLH